MDYKKILIIAGIVIAVIVIVAVVIAVTAAVTTNKGNPESDLKGETRRVITERKQLLSKMKSKLSIMKMNYDKIDDKIAAIEREVASSERQKKEYEEQGRTELINVEEEKKISLLGNKDELFKHKAAYERNITDIQKLIADMESDIITLEERRETAILKIEMAQIKQLMDGIDNNTGTFSDRAFTELENEAQHEVDYNNAMKSLNNM